MSLAAPLDSFRAHETNPRVRLGIVVGVIADDAAAVTTVAAAASAAVADAATAFARKKKHEAKEDNTRVEVRTVSEMKGE